MLRLCLRRAFLNPVCCDISAFRCTLHVISPLDVAHATHPSSYAWELFGSRAVSSRAICILSTAGVFPYRPPSTRSAAEAQPARTRREQSAGREKKVHWSFAPSGRQVRRHGTSKKEQLLIDFPLDERPTLNPRRSSARTRAN